MVPLPLKPTATESGYWIQAVLAATPHPSKTGQVGLHWWLISDGDAMGYAKTVGDVGMLPNQVQDLEIREDWRSQGASQFLLREIARILDCELYTQGLHTPAGARALRNLRIVPGMVEETHNHFNSFVADWSSREPRIR